MTMEGWLLRALGRNTPALIPLIVTRRPPGIRQTKKQQRLVASREAMERIVGRIGPAPSALTLLATRGPPLSASDARVLIHAAATIPLLPHIPKENNHDR